MALAIDTDPDTDPEDTPFLELNAIRCRMGQKPGRATCPPSHTTFSQDRDGQGYRLGRRRCSYAIGRKKNDLWFDLCRKVGEGRALQGGMAQAIERGRS